MQRLLTPLRRTRARLADQPARGHDRERSDEARVDAAKLQVMTWFSAR